MNSWDIHCYLQYQYILTNTLVLKQPCNSERCIAQLCRTSQSLKEALHSSQLRKYLKWPFLPFLAQLFLFKKNLHSRVNAKFINFIEFHLNQRFKCTISIFFLSNLMGLHGSSSSRGTSVAFYRLACSQRHRMNWMITERWLKGTAMPFSHI